MELAWQLLGQSYGTCEQSAELQTFGSVNSVVYQYFFYLRIISFQYYYQILPLHLKKRGETNDYWNLLIGDTEYIVSVQQKRQYQLYIHDFDQYYVTLTELSFTFMQDKTIVGLDFNFKDYEKQLQYNSYENIDKLTFMTLHYVSSRNKVSLIAAFDIKYPFAI